MKLPQSPRILAFAYACEPGRGSEPGAGWAWSRMLARLGETWVITRRDYQVSIERELRSMPERDRLSFVYVDLPDRVRSWQRGDRGLRSYYLPWQIAAFREARRLQRSLRFDVVWHLTWANAWYGSLAALAGRPFIYGPVGGCVNPPWRLLPHLGWGGAAYEIGRALGRTTARYLNPLARISWNQADLILVQNEETAEWLPRKHRSKARLFQNAVIGEDVVRAGKVPSRSGSPVAVFAGRLEPWKGMFLCLRVLASLPEWRLVVCGAGRDEERMRRLARRLGVDERVEWLGWIPRAEVLKQVREADVFLFPSLHEDAGMVVAEARALGVPIVCLTRGGPRLLAGPEGASVDDSGDLPEITRRLTDAAVTSLGRRRGADLDGSAEQLHLERRTDALRELLSEAVVRTADGDRALTSPASTQRPSDIATSSSFENDILPILGTEARVLHAPKGATGEPIGGGDWDCAVRGLDQMWPLRMPFPSRLLQRLHYDVTGWYWVVEKDRRIVKIDTLDDPRGIGIYAFPTELALTATDDDAESVRAAYLTSKRLRKGITSAREWEHIRSLARSNPGHFQESLERIFGTRVTPRLVGAFEGGVPPDPAVSGSARMHAWLRRVRSPERAASLAAKSLGRLFERVMHPTGLTVVIAGPDGSGKSTLADLLLRSSEGPFRRHLHIHWRPGVLPSLGTILGRAPGDPTDPHGRPAHGMWGSSAALAYYWMDFLLGSWLRVWPIRARSGLVVVERGWWDVAVDPRRYGMQVSPRMVAALGRLLPSPDLVLTLEASVETLAERKGELAAPEAQRQMVAWRRILPRHIHQAFLDVSEPIDDAAASAREIVFERLSVRALRRLGAGWIGLPHTLSPRWILPRGPRRAAVAGLSIYQPVTVHGRIGWELARIAASIGAFQLMPRSNAPPRVVREALASHIPARATLATTRANHPGRYVVAVITEAGATAAIAKVASDTDGRDRLRAEDEALARFGSCLGSTVRAPTVIARADGLLLLEAAAWRPRWRPWVLPIEVAKACGELFSCTASRGRSQGGAHGDLAPWNLLRTEAGWMVLDWEDARDDAPPFFDVFHYLVQAHALLRHPSRKELIRGLNTGDGWVGSALRAYGEAAGVPPFRAIDFFPQYLEATLVTLDARTRDGRRGIAARRALLAAVTAGHYASPP
jgi:glycosyltransferase involved in cell wall biosynthesis